MNRSASISSLASGRGRPVDPQGSSSILDGAARGVNFATKAGPAKSIGGGYGRSSQRFELSNASPVLASRIASAPASEKSCPSAASRTPLHRQDGLSLNSSVKQERRTGSTFSFSRVQAAGGAQGSLGREPDYWSYAAPSPTSAAHRGFPSCSKYDMQPEYLEPASQSGDIRQRMDGSIEEILGTNQSATNKRTVPPSSASLPQVVTSQNEGELEEQEEPQDGAYWQEAEEAKDPEDCSEGAAEALWERRSPQTSAQYPISSRTPRERCAYTTSDDWAIFALHNQYVRPLRDREWVPGEPCIIRRNSFELPPGAYRYSESSCGIPATAFESFVFPNPPRQFLMAARGRTSGNVDFAQPSYFRMGTSRSGARGRCSQLTREQLLDLERMLWFDPEPRLERPFRLYADSKTCLKGRLQDIGHIMRNGW
ncbi:hypothetical protein, conserved [Eimeria praecox]|uniref:Uncharacterized protein n=1 Tax=Eimeria praecox TaxID=51316 RepID=U6GTZ3_9EIME|nr:hypothetical protein, conserved [Eimeria praecox]